MPVRLSEIIKVIEKFAPKELKEDYDNVGLMVGDKASEISSILVSLDTTLKVIEEAQKKNCELILSHHPLLFRKASSITEDTIQGRKIRKAVQNNINIYASHTNLDVTESGINDHLIKLLGFETAEVMERTNSPAASDKVGIGRLVVLDEPMTLIDLCNRVKSALKLPYIRYSGEDDKYIKNIAVINGSGQDYFDLAKKLGADCIISGDTTYHYVSDLREEDVAIIDAGHFGTEWPAMQLFAETLKKLLIDNNLELQVIVSETNVDPYKVV